jgi:type II secretory pathway component GspD/PulD (secretin)
LGDIPILGNFFKHKIKTDARTELIIFLTPYVVGAPMELASVSEKERAKSDEMKALTEQDINKFLEDLPHKDKTKGKHK